ncbi:HicA-like toxin [Mycobacterium Phage Nergal]|nr:HicA-like toxin [Mycobacterium Phage Nergal]
MSQQSEIVAKIRKAAKAKGLTFESVRQGGNHEIYDLDGIMVPIGRGKLDKYVTLKIFKQCEPKLGKGWWR